MKGLHVVLHFALQKIAACSWVFGLIYDAPLIVINKLENNVCLGVWPKEWMRKTFGVYSNLGVFGSFLVMSVLYSRVVYTLWFKSDVQQVNHRQSVSIVKSVFPYEKRFGENI